MLLITALLGLALAAQPAPEAAQPAAQIETVDDLLVALEKAGDDMRTLTAGIRYTRIFVLAADEQIRLGRLYYASDPRTPGEPPARKFAVDFESLEHGNGRIDKDARKAFIFDGQWLVERMHKERLFVKRGVVPPGERFDPLRIGEGPFPIPIGQQREEILGRFEAELLDPADVPASLSPSIGEWLLSKPTYQLRLLPRAEFAEHFELAEIRLWYLKDSLLPRMAWTLSVDENESIVQLISQEINVEIPPDALDVTAPEPGSGWDVDIIPWREPAGAAP